MLEKKNGIFEIQNNNNIYMIGDLHGDYQCMIHCLVDLCESCDITKIYNDEEFNTPLREYLEWKKNNNSIIVFCGDVIHRKRFQDHVLDDECSDVFMLKTLLRLKSEAIKNGGNIIIVAGNHEILNILYPDEINYTSHKNLNSNKKYFTDKSFINEYIKNSYAWIKINNTLITHGGLCSDYLRYLDEENVFQKPNVFEKTNLVVKGGSTKYKNQDNFNMIGGEKIKDGDEIIEFINNKYKNFFTDYYTGKKEKDQVSFNLFVKMDMLNKKKDNMFWCREWGYSGIDCDKFKEILQKVGCEKMIIAHCPQFISPDFPKMINFECIEADSDPSNPNYNIARIDLGMSRCFDYNKSDKFLDYLGKNYNRKISILKLELSNNKIIFNTDSVITKKISCIQYLLIKYGISHKDWEKLNIKSDWLGFEYIDKIKNSKNAQDIDEIVKKCNTYDCKNCNNKFNKFNKFNNKLNKSNSNKSNLVKVNEKEYDSESSDDYDSEEIILCLLYPVFNKKIDLSSVKQFEKLNVSK
jgi:hypothetical protein